MCISVYDVILMGFFPSSLKKDYRERPNYVMLLEHPFCVRAATKEVDMAAYVGSVIERFGDLNESVR